MPHTFTIQDAHQMVRQAADSLKRGEITNQQFRAIAAHGMAFEIRSTLRKKSDNYIQKYSFKSPKRK